MWRVLLHNDDYTTQEFVVWVLESVFRKPRAEAVEVMMRVHRSGIGLAGARDRRAKIDLVAPGRRRGLERRGLVQRRSGRRIAQQGADFDAADRDLELAHVALPP